MAEDEEEKPSRISILESGECCSRESYFPVEPAGTVKRAEDEIDRIIAERKETESE